MRKRGSRRALRHLNPASSVALLSDSTETKHVKAGATLVLNVKLDPTKLKNMSQLKPRSGGQIGKQPQRTVKGLRSRRLKSRRRTVGAPLGAAACVACPTLVDECQPVAQPAVQHRLASESSLTRNPKFLITQLTNTTR